MLGMVFPAATGEEGGENLVHASDPAGDSPGPDSSDLLAAWFALEDGELVARWQVAGMSGVQPGDCWNLDFRVGEDEYWVLYAWVDPDGDLVATVRNDQWLTSGEGSPPVSRDRRPVLHGHLPIEVGLGAPTTLAVRYDSGVFPVSEGEVVKFTKSLWSCRQTTVLDRMVAGDPYVMPAATWRPVPSHNVYRGGGLGTLAWIIVSACNEGEVAEIGAICHRIRPEDRGAAYSLVTTPPMPVSTLLTQNGFSFQFTDDEGKVMIYGEPGGIPRRATRFEVHANVPTLDWEMTVR